MGETKLLEFFVLRYALEEKGSINLGVVVMDSSVRGGFCEVRFARDWGKILSFDPDADVELLECLFRDIEENLRSPLQREQMVRTMESSFSNAIQISQRGPCTTGDPTVELAKLAQLYLGKGSRPMESSNLRTDRMLDESPCQ